MDTQAQGVEDQETSAYSDTQTMTKHDTLSGQQNSVSWDWHIGWKQLILVESNKFRILLRKNCLTDTEDWRTCLREKLIQTEPIYLSKTVDSQSEMSSEKEQLHMEH